MEFPPYGDFCLILDKCPEAFLPYVYLWKKQGTENFVIVNKKHCLYDYDCTMDDMCEALRELEKIGLLDFETFATTWSVKIKKKAGAEGHCLC